jgi:hypothetical protein
MSDVDAEIYSLAVKDLSTHLDKMNDNLASADQRALSLMGIFIAIATAMLGAIVAGDVSGWLLISSTVATGLFYLGAVFCLSSALPRVFYVSSNTSLTWDYYLQQGATSHEMNIGIFAELSRRVRENNIVLNNSISRFKIGAWTGLAAPFLGAAIFLLSFCSCFS